ncbi:MAG: inorganic phosphate transporter [Clostridiales Family XIII bacterium]|jgi:PiT family inorganic phosphate transporter|nr:inorganic phosphate transporter [Clostridiales Family XIII bacterium]
MTITLANFVSHIFSNPVFFVTTALTLGVILVNGWTDAPNAIATCVSTRSMDVRYAISMAAVFNFFGVFLMTMVNSTVAHTIYNMVDFHGDSGDALIALCAGMLAIVLWATAAWLFGIPTSESHALIAGISGAAIALQGGLGGVNGAEWMKVIYGLVLSTGLGFAAGYITVQVVEKCFSKIERQKTYGIFKNAQVAAAAGMAFMHGAQDGQKFMGVFLLGVFLSEGQANVDTFVIPIWLMLLCSAVMALGTSIGGYRIIKAVGMDMVKLEKHQGFAADISAVLCLLIASIGGLPVSTTHTKTTAIMGVGAARRLSCVNWKIAGEMVLTWALTFPGCGLIGFLMAELFIKVF